jgi:hypothetical protein
MPNVVLHEFIALQRETIVRRWGAMVAMRSLSPSSDTEADHRIGRFLDQLGDVLRFGESCSAEISWSAALHGHERLLQGCSVSQVVHDYGDVCQAVTGLAVELDLAIGTEDFQTLNRCLDEAIAAAVSEYGRRETQTILDASMARGRERFDFLTHELRNRTTAAILAFQALKAGSAGLPVGTGAVLERSLVGIRDLISGPLADVSADV